MRKFGRWVWAFLEVVIIIYVIVLTSFLLCKNKYGYTQFGDYTFNNVSLFDERNNKAVKQGDLLIVKNSNDIKEGDIIYYYTVYNDSYIIRSNPVLSIKSDDYSYLYTVDDSGPVSIVGTKVLGKYTHIYPHLGTILNVLESRLGFLFGVLLPILIVFIYQVYEFVMIVRYERTGEGKGKKKKKDKIQEESEDKKDDTQEEVKEEVPEPEEVKEEIPEKVEEKVEEKHIEETVDEVKEEVKDLVEEVKEEPTEKAEEKEDDVEIL